MRTYHKIIAVIALLVLDESRVAAQVASSAAREFRLDAGHSDIGFSIGFMMSTVRGRFDGLRGSLFVDEKNPANSSVTFLIQVMSINTGSAHRDEHLQSADFFDAKKYPMIVFQSSSVERAAKGYLLRGPLTMHGVTRTVTIPFAPVHPMYDTPQGSTIVTFRGGLRIARADFGIVGGSTFNPWFDRLRSATMADSVDITLEVRGWITDFPRGTTKELDALVARIDRDGVASFTAAVLDTAAKNPESIRDQEYSFDQLGRRLLAKGRTKDALAVMEMATKLHPQSAQAHTGFGMALEANGDVAAAKNAYLRALAIDSMYPQAMERHRRLR